MSARAWSAFAAVSVLWGIPYFFVKVAVDDGVPPIFLAWVRVVIGAAVLLPLALRAGVLPSVRGRGRWIALYALLEIVAPFPLIAAGERHLSSSLAAILIASVPLLVAVLAIPFVPEERATGVRLLGLVVGFAGVIALVGVDLRSHGSALLGAGAILLAAVGYAAGPMILKQKFADLDPRASMTAALAVAGLALTAPALADPPAHAPSAGTWVAFAVLGAACTSAAFVFYGMLVAEVGAGRASVITYVSPVFALVLGVAARGERPGAAALAGFALILGGSWLATRSPGAGEASRPVPGEPPVAAPERRLRRWAQLARAPSRD